MDERYHRQIILPEIGSDGQRKLCGSSVLVIGAGGLGAPVLQYLTAAGIGHIGVMDHDIVSESNLNRQVLYVTGDIGHMKAARAAERLKMMNENAEITVVADKLTDENAVDYIQGYDALALCLDSIEARAIANRACVQAGVPFVEAGVHGFYGTVTTVAPGETPCYACIHRPSSSLDETVPILGAMAGWVGCAEALAVIRLLLGRSEPSKGAILYFDGSDMTVERIVVERNPCCDVCGVLAMRP